MIAGGDYKQPEKDGPNLAFTDDGGATWKLAPISPQFYLSAIAWGRAPSPTQAEPSSAVFTVGTAHAAYAENLTGKSWKKTWDLNLNAVTWYAPDKAIAVGPKGLVVIFGMTP